MIRPARSDKKITEVKNIWESTRRQKKAPFLTQPGLHFYVDFPDTGLGKEEEEYCVLIHFHGKRRRQKRTICIHGVSQKRRRRKRRQLQLFEVSKGGKE